MTTKPHDQTTAERLAERATKLLDKLLDHDLQYGAQTGAAQIVDDMMTELRRQSAAIAALEAENARFRKLANDGRVKQGQLEAENERLRGIESAAANLIKVKGRYHTEQAFTALVAAMKEQTP